MSKAVIGGLDLGQSEDYSALVVADVDQIPDPEPPLPGCLPVKLNRFQVRHISRWPLLTPYTKIVKDLKEWFTISPFWHNATLVIDGTGVGRAVVDMIVDAKLPCDCRPYSISAGREPNDNPEDGKMPTVPKKDLVGVVSAALQTRRIKIAQGLELRALLQAEMEHFRVKVDDVTRNESYSAGRDGENDDVLLSLALLVWYGETHGYGNPGVAGIGVPPPHQKLLPPSLGPMKPGNFPYGRPGERGPYG